MRQTQKIHSAMLQSVLRQLNVTGGQAASELPDDIAFPLNSYDDIGNLEKKLDDTTNRKVLVSKIPFAAYS